MAVLNLQRDARRVTCTLQAGGIAIVPTDVGYMLCGQSGIALAQISRLQKAGEIGSAMIVGNLEIQRSLHDVTSRASDIIHAVVEDFDLPLGVLAPSMPTHPFIQGSAKGLSHSRAHATGLTVLLNVGALHELLSQSSQKEERPIWIWPLWNIEGQACTELEEVLPDMMAIADSRVDYGKCKYRIYGGGITVMDMQTLKLIHLGSCHDLVEDLLWRNFRIKL